MAGTRLNAWVLAARAASLRSYWLRAQGSPMGSRLAKGTFWTVLGALGSRALGLAGSVLLARLIGRVPFGELGVIQSTVGLFGTFAGLGLGITATRFVAQFRERDKERCGEVIGFSLGAALAGGLVAGLALVLFGGWLAARTLAAPHLAPLLRLGAGLVAFSALQGAYLGALAGFEAFRRVAWVNWMTSVLGVPLMVLGACAAGLTGIVWAMVIQGALGCAIGHAMLATASARAGVRLSLGMGPQERSLIWKFTLPAFLSSIAAAPAGWLSRTFLVNQPGGYAEIAVVNAANQWLQLATFLPYMMGGVLVPIFTSLYASGRREDFARLVRGNLLLNAGIALAVVVPLVLGSSAILGAYGPGFREGVPIFVVALAGGLFLSLNSLLSRAMQSAGRAWTDLASNALWAAAVLVGSWLLVPGLRGMGLVAAHALAAVALASWQWLVVRRLCLRC